MHPSPNQSLASLAIDCPLPQGEGDLRFDFQIWFCLLLPIRNIFPLIPAGKPKFPSPILQNEKTYPTHLVAALHLPRANS